MKLRNRKTGEVVVEVNKIGLVWNRFGMPADIGQYDSLAELNEEWEDYKPKEPLIKDEKTRKAVRAWAEMNAVRQVAYVEDLNGESCCLAGMEDGRGYGIKFVGWIPTLKDCEEYFIDELCGEEEE